MLDFDEKGFAIGCFAGFAGCFVLIMFIFWIVRTILHMLFGEQVYIYVHDHHFLGFVDLISAAQLLG